MNQGYAHGLNSLQIHMAGTDYICPFIDHLSDLCVWSLWGFAAGHDSGIATNVNRSGDINSGSSTSTASSLRVDRNSALGSMKHRLYLAFINFEHSPIVKFEDSLKDVFRSCSVD
jgi:hypothetical protein